MRAAVAFAAAAWVVLAGVGASAATSGAAQQAVARRLRSHTRRANAIRI